MCKPDKTIIGSIYENEACHFKPKFGKLNELSFDVPVLIERDHELIANPLIELLRLDYLIKFVYDDYIEYFIITKPQSQATDERDLKHIECYSLPYEMDRQKIYDLELTSKNLQETMEYVLKALYNVLDADDALWTIDYVSPSLLVTYRSFNVTDKSLIDFVLNDVAETFNCVPIFDTLTRKMSFYSLSDYSTTVTESDKVKSGNLSPSHMTDVDKIISDVVKLKLNTVNVPVQIDVATSTSYSMTVNATGKANAIAVIQALNAIGVNVILEPYPVFADGSHETDWNPSDINTWFWNWKTVILRTLIDDIANVYDVWALNIASNFVNMEYATGYWEGVIDYVRLTYSGQVIYRTNWWVTATWDSSLITAYNTKLNHSFWQYVDIISVAAYFEFNNTYAVPTVEQLTADMYSTSKNSRQQNIYQELKNFYDTWGKQVFLGELGFANYEYCANEPWNDHPSPTDIVSEQAQANGFQAYKNVFEDEDWFLGFSVFCIGVQSAESHFNVVGNDAEDVISACFPDTYTTNELNFTTNKGLTFDYGKYLKTLEIEPETTEFCTILKPFGEDGLTISGVNPTGQNYLQDYSYYLYPYEEDGSGNVIAHSYYMSDSLCGAILDYNALLETASGVVDYTESGTNSTSNYVYMTNHGLVVGDWILNRNRNNQYSKVAVVVDSNIIATTELITDQTVGDLIYKYKDGTYLKLIWDLEVLNDELTVLQNALTTLNTTLQTYLDAIAVCEETGSTYDGHDVTYWRGLRDTKLTEISSKQTDITNKQTSITNKEVEITALTTSLSISTNFTPAQQKELWQFQKVEKWEDTNYINAIDLYFGAIDKFVSINSPQDVININIVNFLECIEEQINWDKLNIGDIANIRYDVFNTNSTARMIEFDFDFDNQDVGLTLANIYKVKSKKDKLLNELYKSIYTTKEYTKNKIIWNELTVNFNSNNDGIDTIPADITLPATPVEYTINTDSSANVSIAWVFSGTGDAYNVDGFEIRVRKTTDSATYVFGSTLAKEEIYYVDYNQRKFELSGVPCDYYYTFGIRAYRKVRADINTNGILYSDNIVSPSSSTQPSATVDYTGLLDGNNIVTVLSSIATAQETADGQIQGFFQDDEPHLPTDYKDVLLMHMNGTDGAKVFTDECGKTITANGNVYTETSSKKFGTASAYFDGNGDYLSIPDSDDWYFGTGNFTIEMWIRLAVNTDQYIIGQYINSDNYWYISLTSGRLKYELKLLGTVICSISPSATVPYGVAYYTHIVVTKYSTKEFRILMGGSVKGVSGYGTDIEIPNFPTPLTIGGSPVLNTNWLNGYIDELRIVKGKAMYTSSYSVPTAEYTVDLGDDIHFGDIWIDTNKVTPPDSTCIYRFEDSNGGSSGTLDWYQESGNAIGLVYLSAYNAQTTADTKITTFYQASIPTSINKGDLWVDIDDGNKIYVAGCVGADAIATGEWELVKDGNAVQQGTSYNDCTITSADGFKAAHPNGGYTQLKGDGLKRWVPTPVYATTPTGVANTENFSGGVIPTGWEYSGFSVVNTRYRSSGYSLYFGGTGEGFARCYKEITADAGASVSFYYQFWGDGGQARFLVDGALVSGMTRASSDPNPTWTQITVSVAKGWHSFQWELTGISSGDNSYLYIDDVIFEASPVTYSIDSYGSNVGYGYAYRVEINSASTYGEYFDSTDGDEKYLASFVSPVWVQLPDDFKGQNFNIFLSLKDTNNYTNYSVGQIFLDILETDTTNGKFKVQAYAVGNYTYYNSYFGGTITILGYWGIEFTYFATY